MRKQWGTEVLSIQVVSNGDDKPLVAYIIATGKHRSHSPVSESVTFFTVEQLRAYINSLLDEVQL